MADKIDSTRKIDGHSQMGEGVRDHDDATREGRAPSRPRPRASPHGRDALRRVRAYPRSRRSAPLPPPSRGTVEPAASEAKDERLTSR